LWHNSKPFREERDENLDLFIAKTWKLRQSFSKTYGIGKIAPNVYRISVVVVSYVSAQLLCSLRHRFRKAMQSRLVTKNFDQCL
jgi:hypothetical protein